MTQTELYLWDVARSFSFAIEIIYIFGFLLLLAVGLLFVVIVVTGDEFDKNKLIKPAKILILVLSILLTVNVLMPSTKFIDAITNTQETK